ncbi:MAG: hypothetical protein COW00_00310 [Bdellovibrio sp. CG12_big_fil_rev_8_21_14_0_65_39_13]|nr:MAG: hypothetical protein COW78_16685 [Bdellovibrio sp. CG22_combo_CG10-13_8_21_14_all_39_27]PIQ62926.1 MAG: hypothetical protein COW00_00310 [Bdellovibrio sp. CG12_big_fil_rev_8_21_14_0_65_39_13]PIR33280.1 MAG: hypothetical protein COV37_17040 [Bdellovibrio sp. CG11_big_fil_rev_8_21_14_0_20_39_38]
MKQAELKKKLISNDKELKMLKKVDLNKIGDHYESRSYRLVSRGVNLLLDSFFYFKKRKGEIVAGGATFFTLLSIVPVLLLAISVLGLVLSDVDQSKSFVLNFMSENIPSMAPWIMKSLEAIVDQQLKASSGINLLNTLVLVYSIMGVIGALMFGLKQVAGVESKGGFYLEDLKTFSLGVAVSAFMLSLLALSNRGISLALLAPDQGAWRNTVVKLLDSQMLLVLMSLGFFTSFYKIAAPMKASWKQSSLGATAFVGCFIAGKSFYWIYLLYAKESLSQNWGNFYSLFIAVFWVYFLMCSFFYGASVAYVDGRTVYGENKKEGDLPPELMIPKTEDNAA